MVVTISSWGNSQGLRFPKGVLRDLGIKVGDQVKLLVEDHKIIIEPIKIDRQKYDINDLVKKIPKNYEIYEEFDDQVGKEIW